MMPEYSEAEDYSRGNTLEIPRRMQIFLSQAVEAVGEPIQNSPHNVPIPNSTLSGETNQGGFFLLGQQIQVDDIDQLPVSSLTINQP